MAAHFMTEHDGGRAVRPALFTLPAQWRGEVGGATGSTYCAGHSRTVHGVNRHEWQLSHHLPKRDFCGLVRCAHNPYPWDILDWGDQRWWGSACAYDQHTSNSPACWWHTLPLPEHHYRIWLALRLAGEHVAYLVVRAVFMQMRQSIETIANAQRFLHYGANIITTQAEVSMYIYWHVILDTRMDGLQPWRSQWLQAVADTQVRGACVPGCGVRGCA